MGLGRPFRRGRARASRIVVVHVRTRGCPRTGPGDTTSRVKLGLSQVRLTTVWTEGAPNPAESDTPSFTVSRTRVSWRPENEPDGSGSLENYEKTCPWGVKVKFTPGWVAQYPGRSRSAVRRGGRPTFVVRTDEPPSRLEVNSPSSPLMVSSSPTGCLTDPTWYAEAGPRHARLCKKGRMENEKGGSRVGREE